MAEFSMIDTVMTALGMQGNTYLQPVIETYINEVNYYLADAGVPASVIGTPAAAGVVARGVSDLWNYGNGGGKLSPYFYERVIQLSAGTAEE